ncbi:MAG: tRNA-specific adenosine deaminase [Desulfobacteraceae bacterium IS3]|jgi:tRNA(adenine34) deaminase|nr:MAG: tRNA-specific adenosine deaminase [Desulfobacteraceae bacterium IS3]HAO19346.1 tRNA-specific adenosine deaminase [Desulfobacteraceae bacterium]
MPDHYEFMQMAIRQARKAAPEVPIGAVLTDQSGQVLAASHNQTISLCDPTAHAEISVLREGAQKIQNYRLLNTSLYVTIEPCVMCMGAIIHARVSRLVFGAADPKWGAAGSVYDFSGDAKLNHQLEIIRGISETECRELMQAFFRERRKHRCQTL